MSIHLVIIDALNLIRRVHSAQPDPTDIARTINTTTRTLNKIISESKPTHIIADGANAVLQVRHSLPTACSILPGFLFFSPRSLWDSWRQDGESAKEMAAKMGREWA